jgi:hypothetical protein
MSMINNMRLTLRINASSRAASVCIVNCIAKRAVMRFMTQEKAKFP